MASLYSIFIYYVLFYQKNSPPLKKLPTIFQLRWGVLPTLPPSVYAPAYRFDFRLSISTKIV